MADIRSPVDGKVTELALGTEGVVAAAGMTLAMLTQPGDEHEIDLYVPPAYRDQVRAGHMGLLTINALSQRTAPTLRVTLTDPALEPVRDADGNSLHYRVRGVVDPEDIAAAREKLGALFRLSVGMPVNADMNGRNTTLWSFVTGPFTGLLGAAFEDWVYASQASKRQIVS
ncbi:MAG: HlyD family efflux transporter periplasmic adaptor subunit [Rhodobacteraceae bacterium]|nr:HlyD family efflux transporter periplasmic adaptor subunit [Paracoccaceae bacterium]